jgi:anaerobic magnesium-protoporphyrin IX monomethyl ester cyclase
MRVALLSPPFAKIYGRFRSLYKRGFLNPPLGFAYLAGSLEKAGHEVMIVDGEGEGLEYDEILKRVQAFEPKLIGFTATSPDFGITVELAKYIRPSFPKTPFVIGGTHTAIFQKDVLLDNREFDFGVIGDGEIALNELLERIGESSAYGEVEGLIWRRGEEVIQNSFRPAERDLDLYPFPARHLLRNDLYIRNVPYKGYLRTAAFMSSRGCPFNCIYCAVKNIPNGTMVRFRSPENVVEELDLIVRRFGIPHVAFNDDCLTFRRNKVLALCEEIRRRGLKFTWEGLSRADKIDRELLRQMKAAGFVRISIGIESGNQPILDILKKNETLEQIAEGIRYAHEEGIVTRGSVIIGSPYETQKEVENTFQFITSLKELDQVVINIMQPYPGTLVREMVMRGEGGTRLLERDLSSLRRFGNASMEVNDLSADLLVKLQREGMRRFYFRPAKVIRNLVINHPVALAFDGISALRSILG